MNKIVYPFTTYYIMDISNFYIFVTVTSVLKLPVLYKSIKIPLSINITL